MNRLACAAAAVALCGLLGCAPASNGFAQAGKSSNRATAKERGTVTGIELEAGPERTEVLAGEPLYVRINLTNLGKSPVQAPAPSDAPPWEFLLTGQNGAPAYAISSQRFRNRRTDPSRPRQPLMQTLGPMSMQEYRIDLLRWTTEPIAPGKYELTVEYGSGGESIRSAAVPLAVVAPNVTAYAALGQAPEDTFASAFLHQAADGASVLYQRESNRGEPALGVAYSRVVAPPGKAIGSFALGCPVDRWRDARWIGWIEGDAIFAALGSGEKIWARIDASPTGLRGPVLARPAYQMFDGHAIFFAYGLKDGRPFLHRITLKSQAPPAIAAVELPSLPQGSVLAQNVGTTPILVWTDRAQGRYALKAVACPFGGGATKGVERTLVSVDRPILAFDLAPLAATPGDVDVLLGAADDPLSLEYRRIPLVGTRPESVWKLPAPGLNSGEHAVAWAVLAGDPQHAPVALLTAARLLNADARSSAGWKSTAVAAEGRYLTLFRGPESSLWSTWADRPTGLRYLGIQ